MGVVETVPITILYEPLHVISNNMAINVDSDEPVQPPSKLRISK